MSLRELVKELLPAYKEAPWADIEGAVNLCVWVSRQRGKEMTLEQAGWLQEALEDALAAEAKSEGARTDQPKVVVFISGGVLTQCLSNDKELRVILVDYDNIEEAEDKEKAEDEALAGTEDCIYAVY
jgi:hypothetical protein